MKKLSDVLYREIHNSKFCSFISGVAKLFINILIINKLLPKKFFNGAQENCFSPYIFTNIKITPSLPHELKGLTTVTIGGPIWPQKHPPQVRHLRHLVPIISDRIGSIEGAENSNKLEILNCAVWCGHVCQHFGHMIADFSTRIAISAHQHPNTPLLFGVPHDVKIEKFVRNFFWEIVEALGANASNIFFIQRTVIVRKLIVYPQAERLYGPPPAITYLNLLNKLHPPTPKKIDFVFFSRGNYLKGGIAGERYFEKIMAEMPNVLVIRPESLKIKEQLLLCRQAKNLIITEGSALHLLQLIGNELENLIVLCRRNSKFYGKCFGYNFLKNRANNVCYIQAVSCTLSISLFSKVSGMSILDINLFLLKFKSIGLNLNLDLELYKKHFTLDVINWITHGCPKEHLSKIYRFKKYLNQDILNHIRYRMATKN